MTQVNAVKADFDEWMSGKQWLGEKAPAEGFYGRYKPEELKKMRIAFEAGADGEEFPFAGDVSYSIIWSYEMAVLFTKRLNETQG